MNHNFIMATHILCHLAVAQKKGKGATSDDIARHLITDASLVRRLAMLLLQKGLINTRVGFGGGYGLAKKAEEINFKDIFEAVEELNRDFWGLEKMTSKQNILPPVTKNVQIDVEKKLAKTKDDMLLSLSLITISEVAENAAV